MCSREELLRQLIAEASVLTDEEVEEVLEYAKKEFEAAVEEGKKGKKGIPALLSFFFLTWCIFGFSNFQFNFSSTFVQQFFYFSSFLFF